MTQEAHPRPVETYRSYLELLARARLHPAVRARLSASDLVQETLLEAHRDRGQFRGHTPGEQAAWLRRILARNLANAVRHLHRMRRDPGQERSIDHAVEESCARMRDLFDGDATTPSERIAHDERLLLVVRALDRLSADRREAVVQRYWEGASLSAIAERMGRTPAAVAGLLHRGLRDLRGSLARLGETWTHDATR